MRDLVVRRLRGVPDVREQRRPVSSRLQEAQNLRRHGTRVVEEDIVETTTATTGDNAGRPTHAARSRRAAGRRGAGPPLRWPAAASARRPDFGAPDIALLPETPVGLPAPETPSASLRRLCLAANLEDVGPISGDTPSSALPETRASPNRPSRACRAMPDSAGSPQAEGSGTPSALETCSSRRLLT